MRMRVRVRRYQVCLQMPSSQALTRRNRECIGDVRDLGIKHEASTSRPWELCTAASNSQR